MRYNLEDFTNDVIRCIIITLGVLILLWLSK